MKSDARRCACFRSGSATGTGDDLGSRGAFPAVTSPVVRERSRPPPVIGRFRTPVRRAGRRPIASAVLLLVLKGQRIAAAAAAARP